MTVELSLFGSPTITHSGQSSALPFERRTQLLAFLALRRSWVGRAELATLLWPDQETKLAYANLRKALFRLQSLPWADRIESQGGALRFDAATDVLAFEAALREHRIADAMALRRGEFLAGFDDDGNDAWTSWLSFERDRLRVAWRSAAQEQLAGELDTAVGIELAARLLEEDPLDEAALRSYMSWLMRAGQGARAGQSYRDFVKRLSEELGLAPSAELKAMHDAIGNGAPAAVTAARPTTRVDDSFIGRAVELRRIGALLSQDDCRLLCLTGPGGVGKTRLSQRLIQEFAARFEDGVTFVPLDDLSSARELGGRLARELGVELKGRSDALDQVIESLRRRHALLVLDNFEQLAADASILDRLLAECPRLKLVVTSRVRLALATEWLLPLEGLPCPEQEDTDHIESFDAARLFVRAAHRVEPSLVPAAEAVAIVDICQQVEGLPLALEMAAAWTRVLSCAAIADELRHGTELLHATDRMQPSRHASIDVVFEQSWRLLSDVERKALAQLSVFHGSFSPAAARTVAGARVPVLAALADKSLLHKDGTRLRLHPLVQQLAAARLGNGEERQAAEREHARYFHDMLHQLRRLVENGDRSALAQVETDFENCRAAWRWAVTHEPSPALMRSVSALTNFCDHRSRFEDGLSLLREAGEAGSRRRDPTLQSLLLGKAAHLEYRLDRYTEAIATATRGLEVLGDVRDADARGQCLMVLGTCQLRLSNNREAMHYLEESLELAPDCSDLRHRAGMLTALALAHKGLGDYDATLRLTLEALDEQRRLGDVGSEALSLNNLAAFYIERLQFDSAAQYLTTALSLCEQNGLAATRGAVLINLMLVALNTGQFEAAESHGRRALEYAQSIGNRFYVSFLRLQFVSLLVHRGDLDAARTELRTGVELAIAVGRPVLLIQGLVRLGEILVAQGEVACGRAVATFAADHPLTAPLDRDETLQKIATWPSTAETALAWPGLTLEDVAHRIVIETGLAHAPLIATLRGAR